MRTNAEIKTRHVAPNGAGAKVIPLSFLENWTELWSYQSLAEAGNIYAAPEAQNACSKILQPSKKLRYDRHV